LDLVMGSTLYYYLLVTMLISNFSSALLLSNIYI